MPGIKPGAAGPGSHYANYCAKLPLGYVTSPRQWKEAAKPVIRAFKMCVATEKLFSSNPKTDANLGQRLLTSIGTVFPKIECIACL